MKTTIDKIIKIQEKLATNFISFNNKMTNIRFNQTELNQIDSKLAAISSMIDNKQNQQQQDIILTDLIVTGFSASNFGGRGTAEDPNGTYKLSNPEAAGSGRVWIKDNYFKIFNDGGYGGWYLDNIDDSLGRSVYPKNATDTAPYKDDGSSYEWQSMGSLIPNASVALVSGADSGSSGNTDNNSTTINVTGYANLYLSAADGTYTYNESLGYYTNDKNKAIRWITPNSTFYYKPTTAQWCITDVGQDGEIYVYSRLGGTENDISTISCENAQREVTVEAYSTTAVTIIVNNK